MFPYPILFCQILYNLTKYFMSAMGVSRSDELRQFVFVSVVLLMAVYVIIKFVERYRKGWCLG